MKKTPLQRQNPFTIFLASLWLLWPAAAWAGRSKPVPVFVGGKGGYACYRIPAMVTTKRGTIIAAADGRISSRGDIPNRIDLVMKRSFDNGRTWTPLQIIAGYGSATGADDRDTYPAYGLTLPIQRVAAGDAALLLDRTNGRVWVLYDNGAAVSGLPNNRAIKLEMRHSDNDGAKWSPRIDIERQNPKLRPRGGQFLAAPGHGIQLSAGHHAGRLIFPVYLYGPSNQSMVIYSDDHGRTWQRGGSAGSGGGEMQVAETSHGGLLAAIRSNSFPVSGVRYFNRSPDGGTTWGAPYRKTPNQPALADPKCQGSLLRFIPPKESRTAWILFANAANPVSRVNLTVRVSFDEGRTWPVRRRIYSGKSAYSDLTQLAGGDAGLLFEADDYARIDFVRCPAGFLSGGAVSHGP